MNNGNAPQGAKDARQDGVVDGPALPGSGSGRLVDTVAEFIYSRHTHSAKSWNEQDHTGKRLWLNDAVTLLMLIDRERRTTDVG